MFNSRPPEILHIKTNLGERNSFHVVSCKWMQLAKQGNHFNDLQLLFEVHVLEPLVLNPRTCMQSRQ